MKRAGRIAIAVWGVVLAVLLFRAMWWHYIVEASAARDATPSLGMHMSLLVFEGRDVLLALAALSASVFMMRSSRRAPSVILSVIALIALLLWAKWALYSFRNSTISMSISSRFDLLDVWLAFLDPPLRCLLAGIGFVCGITGIIRTGKNQVTEHAESTSSLPASRYPSSDA